MYYDFKVEFIEDQSHECYSDSDKSSVVRLSHIKIKNLMALFSEHKIKFCFHTIVLIPN